MKVKGKSLKEFLHRFGAQVVRLNLKDERMMVHALVELKDLIAIPNVVERLKVPLKTDKRLGPNKNAWCEFHQAFSHPIHNCLTLGHQLDELVKNGFLKDYVQEKQGTEDVAVTGGGPGHEVPVHGEIHTIAGGFSGEGCTASQRRRYTRAVMSVEAQRVDDAFDVGLVFTKADLQDVVPHDNDPVVISVVTAGRKVHRVLVGQGSSTDVMFWTTFNKLQMSTDKNGAWPSEKECDGVVTSSTLCLLKTRPKELSSSSVPAATTTPFSLLSPGAGTNEFGAEVVGGGRFAGVEVPTSASATLRLASNPASFFFSALRAMSA